MEIYPKPVTKQCIEKILEQMNNQIYIINENNENYETGYFCSIRYKEKNISIPVLIINKYLKEKEINNNIKVTINKEKINIEIGDTIYKNKDYNFTIFEIKNKENYSLNDIEIDDILYEKEPEIYYIKKPIYIIQGNNKKEMSLSYGIIKNFDQQKLIYSGEVNSDFKYSLIFNLSNNKLIGINGSKSKYYNEGMFLKNIIKEFIQRYKYVVIFKRKHKYIFSPLRYEIKKILYSLLRIITSKPEIHDIPLDNLFSIIIINGEVLQNALKSEEDLNLREEEIFTLQEILKLINELYLKENINIYSVHLDMK